MATMRGYYKEELARSINNIEMALLHLTRLVDAYNKDHPDISEALSECGDALVIIAETIAKVRETI